MLILLSRHDCTNHYSYRSIKIWMYSFFIKWCCNFPETVTSNGLVFERDNEQSLIDCINEIIQKSDNEPLKISLASCNVSKQFANENSAMAFLELFNYKQLMMKGENL